MGKSKVLIRNAKPRDLDKIKLIADLHKKELGFVLRPALEKGIQQKEVVVALKDEELIGFVHFHHRRDGQTTLYNIVVLKNHRGEGVGRQLIDELINRARKMNKYLLLLKCPEELPANHFYGQLGFKQTHLENGKERKLLVWKKQI
jgi:N-acetylglutamate synthase-like GNAT family acetyltransferase